MYNVPTHPVPLPIFWLAQLSSKTSNPPVPPNHQASTISHIPTTIKFHTRKTGAQAGINHPFTTPTNPKSAPTAKTVLQTHGGFAALTPDGVGVPGEAVTNVGVMAGRADECVLPDVARLGPA